MTSPQLQGDKDDRREYQAWLARRIGVVLALLGVIAFVLACVTSCTAPEETRVAIIPYTARDSATGQYRAFHCPVCGKPATATMTAWTCAAGHVSAETIHH